VIRLSDGLITDTVGNPRKKPPAQIRW
jgi:hypothetical protein